MTSKPIAAALLCALLAGCGGGRERPEPCAASKGPTDWRAIVTDADRTRIRNWRQAWTEAMVQVRSGGRTAALAPFDALFEPDRALANPLPPPGDYRCRTVKLGAKTAGMPSFNAYPWFACRIERERDVLSFTKDSGSQRPVGLVFPDSDVRAVFLGTLLLGDETSPLRYGQDRARDIAGTVERIGDRRWRMTLPYPAFESVMDVVDLVPVSAAR